MIAILATSQNWTPKKIPLKSQIPNGREKRMKRKHHYKQTILSTVGRHLCLASPANRVFVLSGSRPAGTNRTELLSPVCPQPAVCPEGCGKDSLASPNTSKSPHCRVRSDNKIECQNQVTYSLLLLKTKFTDLPLVTTYWPVTSLLPCTSWAVTHVWTQSIKFKNPCVVVLYYSDKFLSALP
jgi:hypothetical protein